MKPSPLPHRGRGPGYSDSAEIFRLKPGEEVVRNVIVPSEKAPEGRVLLTVYVDVVVVTPGVACEEAVVVTGTPSAEILVQPAWSGR